MKLRFTIRDLLWLTLVVAIGVGWWIDHKPPRYEVIDIGDEVRYEMLWDHQTGQLRPVGDHVLQGSRR